MNRFELFNNGHRKWVCFARDPGKSEFLIDTNEYLIVDGGRGMLLDPGGIEIFPAVVAMVSKEMAIDDLQVIFASHQDPDICSSLDPWLNLNPDLQVYVSWVWMGFIPHFGGGGSLKPIPDEGMILPLGDSNDLVTIPAHYCHSSGNFSLYDPEAKILFSGDIGAALLPAEMTDLYVEDFDAHIEYMENFHRRWMPSNKAKNRWVELVRKLEVELMCPQHGAIFKGDQVGRFLDWFEQLDVGSAI